MYKAPKSITALLLKCSSDKVKRRELLGLSTACKKEMIAVIWSSAFLNRFPR